MSLFEKIDRIYCINFISSTDRKKNMIKLFKMLGVLNKVKFIHGHPSLDFKCSCKVLNDHLEVYKHALINNYECVCVFEFLGDRRERIVPSETRY